MKRLVPILLFALLPGGALAQSNDDLVRVLRTADRGDDYIRLTLADRSIEGRIRDLDADSVHLAGGGAALAEIDRVEERFKEGGGATIGALAGGLGMMLLLVPLAGLCESDCDSAPVMLALVGATLGGTVGGLVGALIAPADERWEERWRGWP